jgi:hypothetical protein
MKALIAAIAVRATVPAASASAASKVNLSGRWQCVARCGGPPGAFAFITQNGSNLRILNTAGVPSKAWIDHPGHIWVDRTQEGALYSPNGLTLQFDRGAIWRRISEMPGQRPVLRGRG